MAATEHLLTVDTVASPHPVGGRSAAHAVRAGRRPGRRLGRRQRGGGVLLRVAGGVGVVSMDGSSTDVPDTEENDEYFGRPSNATRAGAFPQVRWIVAA